jgi:hypothetical protein
VEELIGQVDGAALPISPSSFFGLSAEFVGVFGQEARGRRGPDCVYHFGANPDDSGGGWRAARTARGRV